MADSRLRRIPGPGILVSDTASNSNTAISFSSKSATPRTLRRSKAQQSSLIAEYAAKPTSSESALEPLGSKPTSSEPDLEPLSSSPLSSSADLRAEFSRVFKLEYEKFQAEYSPEKSPPKSAPCTPTASPGTSPPPFASYIPTARSAGTLYKRNKKKDKKKKKGISLPDSIEASPSISPFSSGVLASINPLSEQEKQKLRKMRHKKSNSSSEALSKDSLLLRSSLSPRSESKMSSLKHKVKITEKRIRKRRSSTQSQTRHKASLRRAKSEEILRVATRFVTEIMNTEDETLKRQVTPGVLGTKELYINQRERKRERERERERDKEREM